MVEVGELNHLDDAQHYLPESDLVIDEPVSTNYTTTNNHQLPVKTSATNSITNHFGITQNFNLNKTSHTIKDLKPLVFKEVKRPGKSTCFTCIKIIFILNFTFIN